MGGDGLVRVRVEFTSSTTYMYLTCVCLHQATLARELLVHATSYAVRQKKCERPPDRNPAAAHPPGTLVQTFLADCQCALPSSAIAASGRLSTRRAAM
jgi:hypothetical protein